jgi:transcriptional regulator with XRE-family HTH domain
MTEINELFRKVRKDRGLSQGALAEKLGLRQSQISDLERAAVDARLSTVRDVARALDLELMCIPRTLIPAVEGLLRGATGKSNRPLYTLDEPEERGGDTAAARARTTRRERRVSVRSARPRRSKRGSHPR